MKKLILVAVLTIGFTIASNNKVQAQSIWKTFISWVMNKKRPRPGMPS